MNPDPSADRGSDTAGRAFRLVSRWRLPTPRQQVWEVFASLVDDEDPFRWWPDLTVLVRGDDEIVVTARSILGYRLRFRLHGLWTEPPGRLGLESDGDLEGRATIDVRPDGPDACVVHVRWEVDVTRRWMRHSRPLLAPAFVLAHDAMMRRGCRSLRVWLAQYS